MAGCGRGARVEGWGGGDAEGQGPGPCDRSSAAGRVEQVQTSDHRCKLERHVVQSARLMQSTIGGLLRHTTRALLRSVCCGDYLGLSCKADTHHFVADHLTPCGSTTTKGRTGSWERKVGGRLDEKPMKINGLATTILQI